MMQDQNNNTQFEATSIEQQSNSISPQSEDTMIDTFIVPRHVISQDIAVDQIVANPFQARRNFDEGELEELANSIRMHGFVSRIRIRPHPAEKNLFQLVYGERRLRAAKLVGLQVIPCDIAIYTDDEVKEIGLIENIQRQDLNPLDEALTFQMLLEQDGYTYSIRSIAKHMGKNKSYIEDRLALLRLPDDVKQLLIERPKISLRTLIEIARIKNKEARGPLIRQVRNERMSTEDARTIVNEVLEQLRKRPQQPMQEEQTESLIFQRTLNKVKRRADAAMKQLHEAAEIYMDAPDAKKKQLLAQCINNILQEARKVEDMLS